ncbi:MAG: ATP-binding cassette domain-containing protein, partial [Candidatus Heimdallarchaeaceae archaeon]
MIRCEDIIKIYQDPVTEVSVAALRGLNLNIKEGELVSIIGPSGSGKTTLINMIAGTDELTSGALYINDQRFDKMSEFERRDFRFYKVGVINQFISENLFSHLSVRQNLLIPKQIFYLPREQSNKEVDELIGLLNLEHVKNNTVAKLSGGEAMRLSLGVALAKKPEIILADEPSGQLDSQHTREMIETIKQINMALGTTILVVTHDIRYRTIFEKSFILRDGRLAGISKDVGRDELEFLMHSSEINRAYIDPSNFVRIPDEIKSIAALSDVVEFEIHPSKKMGIFWNPETISRDQIYKLLTSPAEDIEEQIERIKFEDVEAILSREFIPPKKSQPIIRITNLSKGYKSEAGYNEVIKKINLNIDKGDFVFMSGPSGVG